MPIACPPVRVTLDTNVWLDLLVFDDRRCAALARAWREGSIEVSASAACLDELRHIARSAAFGARAEVSIERIDAALRAVVIVEAAADPTLPKCRDRSDQKFIEAAVASASAALVTKDKALLKLAKRLRPIVVVAPGDRLDAWLEHAGIAVPAASS